MGALVYAIENEGQSSLLAADLALVAKPGDLICLSGDLGAGKTHFARGFIRANFGDCDLEVPSPTYLIAINYPANGGVSINHLDLYRVRDAQEMDELGIEEMLEDGIVLVEWPQNAQGNLPHNCLKIDIDITGETTRAFQIGGNSDFVERLKRSRYIRRFLDDCWGKGVSRLSMPADASTRRFEIVNDQNQQRILLDAPRETDGPPIKDGLPYSQIAHLAEEVLPFVGIAKLLRTNGFYTPEIFGYDLEQGLVLMEDLGRGKILDGQNLPIEGRYIASGELLADINAITWSGEAPINDTITHKIPAYDEQAMNIESTLLSDWYLKDGYNVDDECRQQYAEIWKKYSTVAQGFEKSLVQRDFHSPNIVWRDDAKGNDRIGLVDFQDALIGPAAYDLTSLAQDARTSVSSELENKIVERYVECRKQHFSNFDEVQFGYEYAMMGALRVSKILGFCVRVDLRDGKPQYRKMIPQMKNYLKRNLAHEGLVEYRAWCKNYLDL